MKMSAEVRWIAVFFASLFIYVQASNVHRRFEFKYSFKPPYLAQKDGTVPFWEYGGNAIANSDNVRVAPSLKSQKGAIWTKKPIEFDHWEVEFTFRVSGRGRIGADGLAFWYTAQKGQYDGDIFGSSDKWNGLGLFFDSFDNDNKHNNPYIMAVLNDGTQEFDHANDGMTQHLAGCLRDFRNKPYPTRAKIEYYQNVLTLLFHSGMTNNDQDYEMCFRKDNVYLPKNGYFGVSAATGGLADDHDVSSFLTTSLHPSTDTAHHAYDEEDARLAKEYQDYQTKLDTQKEEYRKQHPDQQGKEEYGEWFEDESQRELRQIFSGQSQILDLIRELNKKSDEIVGRQERTLSLMSQLQPGGVQVQGHQGQPGQQPVPMIDTIRRDEVNSVLNNQNAILNFAREIKSFVGDVRSKTDNILSNQARAPTAQVQPIGYDYQSLISELREGLLSIKRDVAQMQSKVGGNAGGCPSTNCLTTTMFLIFCAIQVVVLLGYSIYKDKKDAQAKKFY